MSRLVVFALLWVVGCRSAPEVEAEPLDPHAPQVVLRGVRMRSFRGSELYASGSAEKLTYERVSADFVATGAQMRFPARSSELSVRAPTLHGNLPTRQLIASGGVELRTGAGLVGKTERAHIDAAGGVASGTVPVEVRGPGYALDANRFSLDFETERFVFDDGVTSRLGGNP